MMKSTQNNERPLFQVVTRLDKGMGPHTHVTVMFFREFVVVWPGFRIGQEMFMNPADRQVIPNEQINLSPYKDVICRVLEV